MKHPLAFCWSGGKDSALALHRVRQDPRYEVVALLTTCSEEYQRISMHGVRVELAHAQAREIGLPLTVVDVPKSGTNDAYNERMGNALTQFKAQGVTHVAFGDIFLEDLRRWREAQLAQLELTAVFPLWKSDTTQLMREFVDLGFRSRVCCVSDAFFDESALGRDIDQEFLETLPSNVDPCGENGEFHTFAYAGPIFKTALQIETGPCVYRPVDEPLSGPNAAKGFWFCEILPARGNA